MNLSTDQWNLVGSKASEKGLFSTACHYFRKALEIDPRRHDIRANLADNLRRNWEFDEALVEAHSAARDGMFDKLQFIFGCLYHDMGLTKKALKYFTPKICTTPYGRFCRAQSLLHAEQWAEGFAWNESRLEMAPFGTPPMPMWKGEPLDGKIVAVHHEEGYGDGIAYSRWLNAMPTGSYVLGMPSALVGLMAASFDAPVFNTNEPLPKADYYLPIMSLPHALSVSEMMPSKPYIKPYGRFDVPVDPDARLKVGLVWRSKAGPADPDPAINIHGHQKSIPLELLLPLGEIPGVTLYSLQTDTDDIKKLSADYLLFDLAKRSQGFNDLALFIQEMDVIVSVDTAPLHLAGAMGKRCIGIIACRGGWPYPGLGTRTPWYSSVTLIRQDIPGDWRSVVNELHATLSAEMGQQVAAD